MGPWDDLAETVLDTVQVLPSASRLAPGDLLGVSVVHGAPIPLPLDLIGETVLNGTTKGQIEGTMNDSGAVGATAVAPEAPFSSKGVLDGRFEGELDGVDQLRGRIVSALPKVGVSASYRVVDEDGQDLLCSVRNATNGGQPDPLSAQLAIWPPVVRADEPLMPVQAKLVVKVGVTLYKSSGGNGAGPGGAGGGGISTAANSAAGGLTTAPLNDILLPLVEGGALKLPAGTATREIRVPLVLFPLAVPGIALLTSHNHGGGQRDPGRVLLHVEGNAAMRDVEGVIKALYEILDVVMTVGDTVGFVTKTSLKKFHAALDIGLNILKRASIITVATQPIGVMDDYMDFDDRATAAWIFGPTSRRYHVWDGEDFEGESAPGVASLDLPLSILDVGAHLAEHLDEDAGEVRLGFGWREHVFTGDDEDEVESARWEAAA